MINHFKEHGIAYFWLAVFVVAITGITTCAKALTKLDEKMEYDHRTIFVDTSIGEINKWNSDFICSGGLVFKIGYRSENQVLDKNNQVVTCAGYVRRGK